MPGRVGRFSQDLLRLSNNAQFLPSKQEADCHPRNLNLITSNIYCPVFFLLDRHKNNASQPGASVQSSATSIMLGARLD